ncbi:MAG: gluconate 2-dehydrogenase subunit 3 family protein [Rhodoferax sp.]
MIDIVLDTFLPGDADLGMPQASALDFAHYMTVYAIQPTVQDYLVELSRIARDKYARRFEELDETERLVVVNTSKVRSVRLFTLFLTHCMRAYYSSPTVLKRLNVGSLPPFPVGNTIESDNWDLLEPVYERGAAYREVD